MSSRIPETIKLKTRCRTKSLDQANLFNEFFNVQFIDKRSNLYMNSDDQFKDIRHHEHDVLLILKISTRRKSCWS